MIKRLAIVFALLLAMLGFATPAQAAQKSYTVYTDSSPTTITVTYDLSGTRPVVSCISVKTGPGYQRYIDMSAWAGDTALSTVLSQYNQAANTTRWCVRSEYRFTASTRPNLKFKVTEDIVGPWNPSASGRIYL